MITERFERSQKNVEAEKTLRVHIETTNCEFGDINEKRRSTISASFHKRLPGIKTPKKMNLSYLVHRSAQNAGRFFGKEN